MDNMSSLSSGLPRRATTQQELQDLDANLISEFKSAASAVTKLFKLAGAKTVLSRRQGYVDALQDLLTALEEDSTLNAQSWALERLVSLYPDEIDEPRKVKKNQTTGSQSSPQPGSSDQAATSSSTPINTSTDSPFNSNTSTGHDHLHNPTSRSVDSTPLPITSSATQPLQRPSSTVPTTNISASAPINPPSPPAPPSGMFTFRTDLELPASIPEIPERFEFDFNNHGTDDEIALGDKRRLGSPNRYETDLKRLRRDY